MCDIEFSVFESRTFFLPGAGHRLVEWAGVNRSAWVEVASIWALPFTRSSTLWESGMSRYVVYPGKRHERDRSLIGDLALAGLTCEQGQRHYI